MQVLQIRHGQWFDVEYLILDLKTLSDSKVFIFWGSTFHKFAPGFIMESIPKKTVLEFLLGRWTPLLSSLDRIFKKLKNFIYYCWRDTLFNFIDFNK